jgi:hypothetical protein
MLPSKRLAQHLQPVTCARGQLVEEQDAVVRQRHLARPGELPAADAADGGDGVGRRTILGVMTE